MTFYEKLKKFIKEHKKEIVYGTAFVLVFIIGFGSGRAGSELTKKRSSQNNYSNYNTQLNTPAKTSPGAEAEIGTAPAKPAAAVAASAKAATASECPVKGNIGSGGTKIYHVKGGAFYTRVSPEQCFNTESEAVTAGYKKSSR